MSSELETIRQYRFSSTEGLRDYLKTLGSARLAQLQQEVDRLDAMLQQLQGTLLYHGTSRARAVTIKREEFALTRGQRTLGFMNAPKTVQNLAVFLANSKALAFAYGNNRSDCASDVEVLEVVAEIDEALDLDDFKLWPTELKQTARRLLSEYEGRRVHRVAQADLHWLLDQPTFVGEVRAHGYDAAVFTETLSTRRALGAGDEKGLTFAVFDPTLLRLKPPSVRTLGGLYAYLDDNR